ncbi:putative signal transducing protein [Kosmotoga pacifica]|uniref:DUF2007 domain-containing protein n=1 Tax=Kosmotoga pacifica TaxID=1330330 RepID=A0A0G2ZCD1_9BACT|nr:DUF2007 domain-containing protein [Kosmotoga pacifica]AKI97204.1 hypothetical protein IX53_04565 [Kosmotoga pacifica]
MKKLKETIPLYEAELIKGILENEGIVVELRSSQVVYTDSVVFGEGSLTDVWVPEEMLKRAEKILEEYKGKEL